jgi:hypothetical protein
MSTTATKTIFPAGITAADLAVNPRVNRVYVTIDWPTGRINVIGKHESEWGTTTFYRAHGHEGIFRISHLDKVRSLRAFVNEEIAPLAERVVAGYERHWDGNNHVARFTEDAQIALRRIADLFEIRRENLDIA